MKGQFDSSMIIAHFGGPIIISSSVYKKELITEEGYLVV